ncbi:SLBB domain-containing protein [Alteromonas sp. W364]|uniref:SLBB domain-containing protein n=1 Tax=Alteromonas sp. W364 TaxID=3075610 RepID=UPI00288791EE|nr:SLBB domain-containing protein [Alteromonas sp. W364]MDT0627731.1 SLBB domain-containing protein [Alteromonas sp. W364]
MREKITVHFKSLCLNRFFTALVATTLISLSFVPQSALAQSFSPSPQQIEQFKNLPRDQQEQLAKQMGFDLSILRGGAQNANSDTASNEVDFVAREVDTKEVAGELAKQSNIESASAKLEPFGYDIFENRQEAAKPASNTPVPSNYVIGPGDSVKLQLFGKESGDFELTVNNEGNIDIPELGPLNVAGTSFNELKELVKQKYEQQKIGVTPYVSMGQLRTIQIFLVGEVYQPGPLTISGLSTITTALINSGGVNNIGSLRNIELKRNGKTVATFDLYDLIVFGDTSNDARLEQGDVLFVPTAQNIVSVDGEVRRPAIYEMKPGETVSDLLELVGGFLPRADRNSLQLVHNSAIDGLTIKTISSNDKAAVSQRLENGDFLRVPAANQEFNNAIIVNGAINVPSIIAQNGLKLNQIINKKTILSNTDLSYALVARKGRFDKKTTVIQFRPEEVITGQYNLELQAFDEVLVFNRVGQDVIDGAASDITDGDIKASEDDLKAGDADFLQKIESDRFTTKAFESKDSRDFSRKALLAPLIARLKNEASSTLPVQLAEISGQVKFPGVYPIAEQFVVANLITAAGGVNESAHLESAELSRVTMNDGVSGVKHQKVNLLKQLALSKDEQIAIQSKDTFSVVRIPQWYENNVIELKGEVVFPGRYQVSEGETLSNIIQRAGGLTNKASIRGAVFSREELKQKERENIDKTVEDLRQQLANNNLSNSQFSKTIDYQNATDVLDDLSKVEPVGRMVIDLRRIIDGDSSADILVKNGDVLAIPNITPAVSVIGEVFVSTTNMFDPALSVNDYIDLAGGAREYGDTSKIYIVKANGSVKVPDSNFWFSSGQENVLEPGDTIVVPRDVTNYDNISLWQGVTQIIYQTAVALAAIGSL